MLSEVRHHLDIFLLIGGALLAYHVFLKMSGHPGGIFSERRIL